MLKGQVALVTGASRGIGRAIALELGREGAAVVGTATTESGAADIQKALDAAHIQGWGAVLNVTDAVTCEAVIGQIEKRFGYVSVLVNNAGITRDNLAMRMKDEEWDAVIETNLKAVFRLSKAVMRGMMKARQGRIINITSVVGSSGNPGQANYAAAKAGVIALTKVMGRELARRCITVNAVAPGVIHTPMLEGLKPDVLAGYEQQIPVGRCGRPEEVAHAILFFACEESSYITGQTLPITGGWF